MVGLDPVGAIINNENYAKEVLSRNKSTLYASLDWLIENEVIAQSDIESFERIKSTRNYLAHEMHSLVMGEGKSDHIERFQEIVTLLKKIEVWWVINFELPINPDFDGQEIDESGIVPGPILMIQIMLEVISGNEELLKHYRGNADRENSNK